MHIFANVMEGYGQIEIHITGKKGNQDLSPDNFDIKEIVSLLNQIEPIIYPNKKNRPAITYSIEKGSVRNLFKVTKQAEAAFAAAMMLISSSHTLDGLETATAKAIAEIQSMARKTGYSFDFLAQDCDSSLLSVTPHTNYGISEQLLVDAEFYFYGTLVDAGGKDSSNIHIVTKDYGTLRISADKEQLKNEERNLLYREFGVRASGKQNVHTGEFSKDTLHLIELIDYAPRYDRKRIDELIARAGNTWVGVDVDKYLCELRGYA